MNINLNDLPSSIRQQIPISLRVNKQTLVYETLPSELQFLLKPYTIRDTVVPKTDLILDYVPTLGIYGDWDELLTTSSTVIEYIKNWFKTPIGSYPYDLSFGSNLKKILHTKDTSLQQQLLQNELNTVDSLINDVFPNSLSIINSSISPVEFEDHLEYRLNMQISVLGKIASVDVIQQ